MKIRNYRSFKKEKGVFCIEGTWTNDYRVKTSVLKALEFLEVIENVKTVIRQCPNLPAFQQLVNDSFQARYSHYSILYLAFHGESNSIFIEKRKKKGISLDDLAEIIGNRANGKIIHLGCCSTLDVDGWALRRFLKATNALAISGYKKDIDFVKSTAYDLVYFQQCQQAHDVRKISSAMKKYHKNLGDELGFVFKYFE